jgi:cell division protein FtsQ
MKTVKLLFFILLAVAVAAYLVVAVAVISKHKESAVCHDISLVIRDSVNAGFITKNEIIETLRCKGLSPIGKPVDQILTQPLEDELAKNPLIDRVECYKTLKGDICIEAYQRIPVLRVMNAAGSDYYIDNKGTIMPRDTRCLARLPIATGRIDSLYSVRTLYPFASWLKRTPFWASQIEQINVLPNETVELVPRVGDHIVYLGKLTDYEHKLARVKAFYEKALNKVGWNRYRRISVEFPNQIIATKRE